MVYPYGSPQILTDEVFLLYGGETGTSTAAERQAAYLMAEEQASEHLKAFVVPTIATGSANRISGHSFYTENGWVHTILLIQLETVTNTNPYTTKIYTGTAAILDSQYGYINIYNPAMYGCLQRVTVSYESGLPTGVYTNPSVLQSLTIAAQINLNELDVSLSNESTADIGVQQFSNQSYAEIRTKMGKNAFGDSALAQRASRLIKRYRSRPSTGFR